MGSRRNPLAAAGVVVVLTMTVACSDGATATTTPPSSVSTPTTPTSWRASVTPLPALPLVEVTVATSSIAGLRIDQEGADFDRVMATMTALLGPPSFDSDWQAVPEDFYCHLHPESRTLWWGDLRMSFSRGAEDPKMDSGRMLLVAWSVGDVEMLSLVPVAGAASEPVADVRLDGIVGLGTSEADFRDYVVGHGYLWADGSDPPFVGGSLPVFANLVDGRLVGFGMSIEDCWDAEHSSGM